jgi:hypothetical protein
MPMIDWTEDEAEEVRQLMLDRLDSLRERERAAADHETASRYVYFITELRTRIRKLEAAYAND